MCKTNIFSILGLSEVRQSRHEDIMASAFVTPSTE